jgi:hypothetical protein
LLLSEALRLDRQEVEQLTAAYARCMHGSFTSPDAPGYRER